MAKSHGERELSTRRDTEDRGSVGRQRDVEPRLRPSAHVLDKELLVRREPFRVKGEGGRSAGRLELTPRVAMSSMALSRAERQLPRPVP